MENNQDIAGTVSVIMSVYNAEKYIEEAIESILNQTYKERVELIIIDDCSTDKTPEILQGYKDKVNIITLTKNLGCHAARNKGLEIAKGLYIAPMDADDIALPDRLKISVKVMEETGADMVYGGWLKIDEGGKEISPYQKPLDFEDNIKKFNPVCQGTVMFKRSLGKYEEYQFAADYDLWQRFNYEKRKVVSINMLLSKYRVHEKSTSIEKLKEQNQVRDMIINKWNKIEKDAKDGLISIIMPTYNREDISKAVLSIINQKYTNWELLVVIDGGEKPIISQQGDKRIKIIKIEHRGLSGALNEGLKQVKGKYIAFLDDDDYYVDNHLEVLFNHLRGNPTLGLIYSQTIAVDNNGKELREYNIPKFDRQQQKRMNLFCINSVLVRKECFNTCGNFDETLKTHNDFDMWRRICRYFTCEHIPIITNYYVQHDDMMSKDKEQMTYDLEEVRSREW